MENTGKSDKLREKLVLVRTNLLFVVLRQSRRFFRGFVPHSEVIPMASTRREKIEALLADEPHDNFLRYSLALELEKEGEHERSLSGLRELASQSPPFVPAFFMAAQQLARLQRIEESRAILRGGIEEARRQGNSHAAGEMSELLASLGKMG